MFCMYVLMMLMLTVSGNSPGFQKNNTNFRKYINLTKKMVCSLTKTQHIPEEKKQTLIMLDAAQITRT